VPVAQNEDAIVVKEPWRCGAHGALNSRKREEDKSRETQKIAKKHGFKTDKLSVAGSTRSALRRPTLASPLRSQKTRVHTLNY